MQIDPKTFKKNIMFKELALKKNYKRDRGYFFKYLAII